MNKAFIKIIIPAFVICHLTFVICGAAAADKLEGGGYILYDTINSGGMTLQGGEYILKDSKGEAVGGVMVGGGYSLTPGILKIAAGGVQKIGDAPIGTIPFTISRDGTSIKLTWDANKAKNPSIYVLIGDGTGKYANDGNEWKLFTDPSFGVEFDNSKLNEGILTHNAQGHKEVYYKGLQSGVPRDGINKETNKTNLASAWAVGKVNVELKGEANAAGYNLISIPLEGQNGTLLKDIFGTGSPWVNGDQILKKKSASPAYDTAIYTGGDWKKAEDVNQLSGVQYEPKFGCFVVVNTNKTITFIGNVNISNQDVNVWGGGYTILGMLYPVKFQLASSSLISNGTPANGDQIYYKKSATAPSYSGAIVVNNVWKDAANTANAPPAELTELKIPNGYFYNRLSINDFSWKREIP